VALDESSIKNSSTEYTYVKQLGAGSYGVTYLFKNGEEEEVVIKTLSNQLLELETSEKDEVETKFIREAQLLEKCKHEHIPDFIDVFRAQNQWCLVMSYICGHSLKDLPKGDRRMEEQSALLIIRQMGTALMRVHEHGLVHRDVKPDNIILRTADRKAFLVDFGSVREVQRAARTTRPPHLSAGFAPIELYIPGASCGAFTDIYSLASVLYFILTGEPPANADDRCKNHKDSLKEPRGVNPKITGQTNAAILKAMQRQPTDRPQSMRDWLEMLPGCQPISSTQPIWKKPEFWIPLCVPLLLGLPQSVDTILKIVKGIMSHNPSQSQVSPNKSVIRKED
jgi:eukaryotic-like serine/threonine-protein kinase